LNKLQTTQDRLPPTELMLAAMAYAVGDSNSGRRLLESAAISDGDYPGIYFSFARLALLQNRITDADALADKALMSIQGSNGAYDETELKQFKIRYYDTKYRVAKGRNKKDEAKAAVAELQNVAPEEPQTLVANADIAFQFGELNEALGFLKRLDQKQLGDRFRPAEVTLAGWLQGQGKTREAGALLKNAARERQRDDKVQRALAQWSLNQGDFPGTLQAVKTMEEVTGDTNITRELRGKAAFAQNAYSIAEKHFKRLTEDNPSNFDYGNLYALSLVQSTDKKKQDLAVNLAKQIAQARSSSVVARSSLAYVLMKTGQLEPAKAILSTVVKQPNLNAEVSFIICYMMSETGQKEQSQPILEKITKAPGLFLFRNEALKLYKRNAQSSGSLPAPTP